MKQRKEKIKRESDSSLEEVNNNIDLDNYLDLSITIHFFQV